MAISRNDYEASIAGWLNRSSSKNQSNLFVPELAATIATTIGEVRSENQDRAVGARFLPAKDTKGHNSFSLLILSDGIGGMLEGERCAESAVASTIIALVGQNDNIPPIESLRRALETANREVFKKYRGRGGATVVAILFCRDGRLFSATAGDSRIYRCTPSKMVIEQTSVDDTIAGELSRLRGTEIREEQLGSAAAHLAQFVGIGDAFQPRIQAIPSLSKDEWLLLTSDGAHSIGANLMAQLAAGAPDPQTLATRLLYVSRWCGGYDNATVICSDAVHKSIHNRSSLNSACLELWDAFGKLELFFDSDYLRPEPVGRELNPDDHLRNELPTPEKPADESEPPSTKKKGKREGMQRRERQLEIQVAKEAIQPSLGGGREADHIGDLDLSTSAVAPAPTVAPDPALEPQASKPDNILHSEDNLRTHQHALERTGADVVVDDADSVSIGESTTSHDTSLQRDRGHDTTNGEDA